MGQSKRQNKTTPPQRPDLAFRELDMGTLYAHLERGRQEPLGEPAYTDLRQVLDTVQFFIQELASKNASIARLKSLLFGPKTEKSSAIFGTKEKPDPTGETTDTKPAPRKKSRKKAPGHGRNGAAKLPGAKHVKVPLEGKHSGDPCPNCNCSGKIYLEKTPHTLIRFQAVAPIQATVYEMERWRCNRCSKIDTAPTPPGVGEQKYDESVAALLGELRYGVGLPHPRIETLQNAFGIPLPASTQWQLLLAAAGLLLPAHAELVRQAAQGQLLHIDDTRMKILNKNTLSPNKEGRVAVQTTGILAHVGAMRIALFITGMNHAGENLEAVLKHRATDLAKPIQMSDALAANMAGEEDGPDTILAHCLVHARRKFVEIAKDFPQEVRMLLKFLRLIYRIDARTKARKMDPAARLAYHQRRSKPIMDKLAVWLQRQSGEKRVEPNSDMGRAIKYMQNHWTELTLFLCEPGAPLDNSAAERLVKRAIIHRKNSLFYRSQVGARVGDTFMSLIHTAELNGVQSFNYLVALLRNAEAVAKDPGNWMPWNYPRPDLAEANSP